MSDAHQHTAAANVPQRTQRQVRDMHFDLAARQADGAIPVVVSTDAPVVMPDGVEVLVHTPDAVDLSRAPLPIIVTHARGQVNVGIVDGIHFVNGQMRGLARFGVRPEAAAYRQDVEAGILRSVSVGYARLKSRPGKGGALITYRWLPTHAAIVGEPADAGAGFYREGGAEPLPPLEIADEPTDRPAVDAPPSTTVSPPAATTATTPGEAMSATQNAAAGESAETRTAHVQTHNHNGQAANASQPQGTPGNQALEIERGRRRAIENLCQANQIDTQVRDYWIGAGLSLEAVSDDLLNILKERGASNPKSQAKLGLTNTETQSYSLRRAILAAAENNWTQAGMELECSREIAKRLNVVPDAKRFYVPFEVQQRSLPLQRGSLGQRDLNAATPTAGGHLVETQNVSFIEMMRNRSVAYRMGAMRLGGLQGNITVPKQVGAANWYWLASETSGITESQLTLAQMALSPKTGGAYTEISRQLLLQSSPSIEALVTADLGRVGGLGVDSAVLAGSGSAGQPLGITGTAGIGSVTGATLGYAGILEFQSDIATANVLPTMGGYVTTPSIAALMMQRVKWAGTASPLWDGNLWDGNMAGFSAMSSNQMAAASMLFGDWSAVVVAEWGVLEIEVNPFANFQAGIVGVRAMVSMDCGLRYPAAFSLASSIT